jgi:hypothetical protein
MSASFPLPFGRTPDPQATRMVPEEQVLFGTDASDDAPRVS